MFKTQRSHSEFQNFLTSQLICFLSETSYRGQVFLYADAVFKVFLTDLTAIRKILADTYNPRGERPWDPVCLFRSLWLMVQYQDNGSITDWVDRLHSSPFWAILSGFHPDHVPGVGTFYDFFKRLCDYDQGQRVARTRKMRKPRFKPQKKLKSNQKLPPKHQGIVQRLVDRIIRDEDKPQVVRPDDKLLAIFKRCFLTPSVERGLIDPHEVAISGDGTLVATGASPYGNKDCDCRQEGQFRCDCPRRMSDPDANWGWDSHREMYVFGYANYTFTLANSPYDLPIFSTLAQASRHDSVTHVCSLARMVELYPELNFAQDILDSAHDNYATYELLHHYNIEPFIALNKTNSGNYTYPAPLEINSDGVPICPAGYEMAHWGFIKDRCRIKWRCPAVVYKNCECDRLCSPSPYGRTFYTKPDWDRRIFTPTPRNSDKWKETMKQRSSSERRNSQVKINYNLESDRVRSKSHWMIRTILRDAAIHADTWVKEFSKQAQDWVASWFPAAA